jgi:hypothetical protein
MDDLIPLTDFDLRQFPQVSEDEKADFILYTNKFERINFTKEAIVSDLVQPHKAHPGTAGQYRALNLILQLATDPLLVPINKPVTHNHSLINSFLGLNYCKRTSYMISIGVVKNLITFLIIHISKILESIRIEEKVLGSRKMPEPSQIKILLCDAFNEYINVYKTYAEHLNNPRMMEFKDWKKLETACYKLNLRICCIKPFKDGSNRVGRLTENLLRLNVGLKFKTFDDSKDLLDDIWKLQDSGYRRKD